MLGVWHITSHTLICHWRELPQASFWSRQAYFCRDKHTFVATSILLSRQKPCFVATNTCLSRQKLVETKHYYVCRNKYLSRQKFCRYKHTFVATKDVFCGDKHEFVDKHVTNTCLSPQKMMLVATKVCLSRPK